MDQRRKKTRRMCDVIYYIRVKGMQDTGLIIPQSKTPEDLETHFPHLHMGEMSTSTLSCHITPPYRCQPYKFQIVSEKTSVILKSSVG